MALSPEEFVGNIEQFVSVPEVCFKIYEMVENQNASSVELAEIVCQDASLASHVLRVANSSYYGFESRVDTISRAVSIIGQRDLQNLVLSTSVINAFGVQEDELINLNQHWVHSLFTGILARHISSQITPKILHKERLFVAGLLHDIGQLLMVKKIPEMMRIVNFRAKQNQESWRDCERLVFGLDHGEIGSVLMRQWHFPDSLQAVAKYHHIPALAKAHNIEVSIVHIADVMAERIFLSNIDNTEQIAKISKTAWQVSGLSKPGLAKAISCAKAEFKQAGSAYLPTHLLANY